MPQPLSPSQMEGVSAEGTVREQGRPTDEQEPQTGLPRKPSLPLSHSQSPSATGTPDAPCGVTCLVISIYKREAFRVQESEMHT